ncbi:MAG: DNA-protecting protein DprA, partial [Rhizobiales bacterium]|nr:DNA-protecting protein DprA [Hyphomicrobiales bacterium]
MKRAPAAASPVAAGGVPLTEEQRLAWLRLIRSENVGPATFRSLINHFGSAQAALDALPDLSRRGGASRAIRVATPGEAADEMAASVRIGARFVGLGEPLYPPWLRHADAPPPLLAVRGAVKHLTTPAVAIVGARNASVAGRKMATLLAKGLGEAGFVVISGLARGIDAAAHEAALTDGTIAVFAGGLDNIYPPENAALFDRIIGSEGCGVSEMRFGWAPRARDFPRRNRIIAGMSLATVVVEAAERSGSLITARLALEQNREVLAVPGSPLDPRATGSNNLLKQGARIVTESRDIVEAIAPMLEEPPEVRGALSAPVSDVPISEPAESERARIVEALGPTPIEVDEIIRFTGIPARAV